MYNACIGEVYIGTASFHRVHHSFPQRGIQLHDSEWGQFAVLHPRVGVQFVGRLYIGTDVASAF